MIFLFKQPGARSCFNLAESKIHCGWQHPFVAAKENGFACSDRCGTDFPRPILIFAAAKENGFACSIRRRNDLPCPILFFVAAKENGFACSGRRGSNLPRPILIFVVAKKNGPPAGRH